MFYYNTRTLLYSIILYYSLLHSILFFVVLFFFNPTYSRWTSSLPSCLWSQRIFPSLPGSRFTILLSRCKFSTLTTRQPMVEFYLLTFPRFPLRKKEHKSYFGKNRAHDFRTSRCCCCCCFLTLTDPLRILQPWSQDRRNQTKSNRESEMSMESIQKRTDKK